MLFSAECYAKSLDHFHAVALLGVFQHTVNGFHIECRERSEIVAANLLLAILFDNGGNYDMALAIGSDNAAELIFSRFELLGSDVDVAPVFVIENAVFTLVIEDIIINNTDIVPVGLANGVAHAAYLIARNSDKAVFDLGEVVFKA